MSGTFDTPEQKIVWLHCPTQFDYVRQSTLQTTQRTGSLEFGDDSTYYTTIGYAELTPDATGSQTNPPIYSRRIFWLKEPDRPLANPGPGDAWYNTDPAEAVDPQTIEAES